MTNTKSKLSLCGQNKYKMYITDIILSVKEKNFFEWQLAIFVEAFVFGVESYYPLVLSDFQVHWVLIKNFFHNRK